MTADMQRDSFSSGYFCCKLPYSRYQFTRDSENYVLSVSNDGWNKTN